MSETPRSDERIPTPGEVRWRKLPERVDPAATVEESPSEPPGDLTGGRNTEQDRALLSGG